MKFYEWLETQKGSDSPIGDLAIDLLADARRPINASHESVKSHLASQSAVVRDTFEEAWKAYIKSKLT